MHVTIQDCIQRAQITATTNPTLDQQVMNDYATVPALVSLITLIPDWMLLAAGMPDDLKLVEVIGLAFTFIPDCDLSC